MDTGLIRGGMRMELGVDLSTTEAIDALGEACTLDFGCVIF